MRATSRWLVQRTLPSLENRSLTRIARPQPAPTGSGRRACSTTGTGDGRPADAPGDALAGALAAARGGDRRGHDVLEAVAGAHAAVVAGRPAAVLEAALGQRGLPVLPEEVAVEPGGDVVPRQHLVLGAVAVDVPVDGEALGGHGVLPAAEVEHLAPLLERAALPPHPLDHRAEAPVAPAGDALGQGGPRVVPLQLHPLGLRGGVAQQADLAAQLGDRVLAEPLERACGAWARSRPTLAVTLARLV